jgi:ubiquinone/menaquinone biosynthesis C-methylase UbiE
MEPHDHVFDASDTARLVAQGIRAQPLIEAAELRPDDHALDVGCGPGIAVELATHTITGGRVTGIDPSEAMLDEARRRTHDAPGVVLEQAAAESIPVDDASVDVAWALNSLHHWHERAAGLAEVHRVLRSAGRFIVVEQVPHERRALDETTTAALVDELTAAGFDVLEARDYEAAGETHTLVRTVRAADD